MKITHLNRTKRGFTLIEILVVMAIIGILSGLIFAGVGGAMRLVKKVGTQNTAHNVSNAISAYYTEYRRLPKPTGFSDLGDYSEGFTNAAFMQILLGDDETKNPRQISFFTGKRAKPFQGGYVKGIGPDGNLWDYYGSMFKIRLDTTNRSRLIDPDDGTQTLYENVIVWSAGADKDFATSKDNVTTW